MEMTSILAELRAGRSILLIDDTVAPERLLCVAPAACITEQIVAFLARECGGVIVAPVSESHLRELDLPSMVERTGEVSPPLSISVEARTGVTTGISARDRAVTLKILATTSQGKRELVTPGHVFPVGAKRGGVLVRTSPVEAAVDLLSLAGLPPVAAMSHCLSDGGEFLATEKAPAFADIHGLVSIRTSEIVRYRLATEPIVERVAEARLPTRQAGEFRAVCFRTTFDDAEHLALVKGEIEDRQGESAPLLVRVQTENLIGDLLGAEMPRGSRDLTTEALQAIEARRRGIFVYIRHPRRAVLQSQVRARADQAQSAMSRIRDYGVGAQILAALGARRIIILSNSHWEIQGIEAFQLEIVGREPLGERARPREAA